MAKNNSGALQLLGDCLRVIAGRKVGAPHNGGELLLDPGVDLTGSGAAEFSVLSLVEIRRAIVEAGRLCRTLSSNSPMRHRVRICLRMADDALSFADEYATRHFQRGAFNTAKAIASDATSRIEREASTLLLTIVAELDLEAAKHAATAPPKRDKRWRVGCKPDTSEVRRCERDARRFLAATPKLSRDALATLLGVSGGYVSKMDAWNDNKRRRGAGGVTGPGQLGRTPETDAKCPIEGSSAQAAGDYRRLGRRVGFRAAETRLGVATRDARCAEIAATDERIDEEVCSKTLRELMDESLSDFRSSHDPITGERQKVSNSLRRLVRSP